MNTKEPCNLKVLMVHKNPCIRVLKETQALCAKGVSVDVLCLDMSNTPQLHKYAQTMYVCETLDDMDTFLQERYRFWDIIHCHNEPNIITLLALSVCTERPVIYDCHDMSSARSPLEADEANAEKLCFTRSQGVVHVSEALKKMAFRKYGAGLAVVLPSYPVPSESKIEASPKLDGTHVVYQGGLIGFPGMTASYRYYVHMFRTLLEAGVHVHVFPPKNVAESNHLDVYTQLAAESAFFHLHQSLPYGELIATMSQFQWGFSGFNVSEISNPNTLNFLNSALPNKFFDYLLAGVCPIVINNKTTADFAIQHGVGYAARDMQDFVHICTTQTPLPPLSDLSIIDMSLQIERLLQLYDAARATMH